MAGCWNDADTIPVNFERSKTFKRCMDEIENKFNENNGDINRQEVIDVLKKNKVDKKFKTQGENLNLEITRLDDIDLTKLEQLRTKIKEIQRNKEEVPSFNEKLFTSKIFLTFKWEVRPFIVRGIPNLKIDNIVETFVLRILSEVTDFINDPQEMRFKRSFDAFMHTCQKHKNMTAPEAFLWSTDLRRDFLKDNRNWPQFIENISRTSPKILKKHAMEWDSSDVFPSFIEINRDLNDFKVLNISMKSEVKPDKKPRKTLQKP